MFFGHQCVESKPIFRSTKRSEYVTTYVIKCRLAEKYGEFMLDTFHMSLSGAAGLGKMFLVKTIAEYLVRIVKHHNQRLDQPSVLVTASTGKAATNIDSVTLHSAFHLPVKRGFYVQPGAEVLYILKIRYPYLKILVIDEISMTGLYFAIW